MKNFEAYAGAAAYVALSLLMTFQALEPVQVAPPPQAEVDVALAGCAEGAAATRCEAARI